MNIEKLEKLKKSLENKFIPDNMKDKIRAEIKKLEAEIKTDDSLTKSEIKEEIKEIEEKVEVALEVAEEKKEQIEEKKKAVKKTKSTVEKRKPVVSTVAKKKTLYTVAKEIRKDGESWEDAKERARKQLKSEKTETQKKVKSEADKIKAFVKRRKELKGIKANDLLRDSKRPALPIGKRRSKDGNVYYEYRENRTDRLAPDFKDKVYLEKGGASGLSLVEVQFADSKYNYSTNMSGNITKEDAEKYFVGKTFDVGTYPKENMQKAIGIKFFPAGTWDDKSYEKGGEINNYNDWESDIINEISEDLEISFGDAQGIVEANEFYLAQSWAKGLDAKETANLILEKSKMAKGGRLKSALMRDRNNFNHFEKHEIAYSKNKPHRKGYGYEYGGNLNEPKELKGYFVHVLKSPYGSDKNVVPTNKKIILVTDGKKGDSFSVMSNEPHLKLVKRVLFGKEYIHAEPKNFERTDLKWKMFGGNFVWSSDSRFRDEVSELPIPLHDRIEYANGGTIIGVAETPLAHEGLPQYSGLVGETGALSAGEMFEMGGSTGLPAGVKLPNNKSLKYFLVNEASSGSIANKVPYSDYKTIDKIRFQAIQILNRDGDREYSLQSFSDLIQEALLEYEENKYEMGGSTGLPIGAEQHFVNYYLGEGASAGMFENGGSIDKDEVESSAQYYADESKWSSKPTISTFQERLDDTKQMKKKLEDKKITPSYVIGKGYKPQYARQLAFDWLNREIAVYERVIEILKERGEKYNKGGSIENQYEGKSPEEVWNMWTLDQREHFLADHYDVMLGKDLGSKNKKFSELEDITKMQLELHLKHGQYEKGGEITSKQKKALEWYGGLSINEMKEASRDALSEYQYKLLHSYSLSKNVSKKRWFELIEKVYDKNSNKYASGGRLKSALMRDRNNFNHFEKHEIAYSKNKPHRKGYGYEDGGNLKEKMTYNEFEETLREYEIEGGYGKITEKGFEMYYLPKNHSLTGRKFKHRNKRKAYKEYVELVENMNKKYSDGGKMPSCKSGKHKND